MKSSPPPLSTSGCDVGGTPPAGLLLSAGLEGGSRAAGGHDHRAAWRLWLRVQGYMFNQTLGDRFDQSLEGGHAPEQLADMTVGYMFN